MTFVADERGRVPFALVAALLLVGSVTYANAATTQPATDAVTPRLLETAVEEARLSLGTTARRAGREAAREPVLRTVDTSFGAVLEDPFVDSIRMRIAVLARETVPGHRSAKATNVTVSLAPISDVASARSALRAVHFDRLADDRVRITLENVSVTIRREGRVVDRRSIPLTSTVALPALTLHDRTAEFEERLTADLRDPGVDRGLTTRLFALAWVRGYAQYGGAPISNVIANRHVGLLTNDALVDQQAATFGVADEQSRRGLARATADVAVADGVSGIEGAVTGALSNSRRSNGVGTSIDAVELPSTLDTTQRVGVDRTADEAFADFVDGGGLEEALAAAYRARVKPSSHARLIGSSVDQSGERPANGSIAFTSSRTSYRVEGGGRSAGASSVLEYDRTVTATQTEWSYWLVNGSYAGATSVSRQRTYSVTIAISCRYDPPASLATADVPERCPFGETARRSLRSNAHDAVTSRYGSPSAMARRAVAGDPSYRWDHVSVIPPASAHRSAYRRTASLREAVRSVSVATDVRSMASTASPASDLARRLEERRAELLDAPRRYRDAAAVAGRLAREAYLESVRDGLSGRESTVSRVQSRLGSLLAERSVPGEPPSADRGTLPPIATAVDAEPSYLSLRVASGEPPLAARNVNVFTVPYGDAGDAVAGVVGDTARTASIATATSTLTAASGVGPPAAQQIRQDDLKRLRQSLSTALEAVRDRQRRAILSETDVSDEAARSALSAAYAQYPTVAARGRAVVEGTIADATAAALPESVDAVARDRALIAVRLATLEARESTAVRVRQSTVAAVDETVRPIVGESVDQAVRAGTALAADRARRRALRGMARDLPAGVPIAPIPGGWYATANVWTVAVRGGYERFEVRSPRAASPYGDEGTISYVREAAPVAIDVDADGRPEVIGRNEAIEVSAQTGVFVVVPPGPSGVGDTDGNAVETSPGW
ncbi:MAG: hypothetical protein ABEJ55_08985 [Halanaeroarchaeum sp.]